MSAFRDVTKELQPEIEDLISRFHPNLEKAGVMVELLMKFRKDTDKGPTLSHQGYPALAYIKIVSLQDRALGHRDARMVIDGDIWSDLGDDQRTALLDHELQHLDVKRDLFGNFLFDDLHRPKLRMRKHDFQFGWFKVIAERHGIASFEVRQARSIEAEAGQILFAFASKEASEFRELIKSGKVTVTVGKE